MRERHWRNELVLSKEYGQTLRGVSYPFTQHVHYVAYNYSSEQLTKGRSVRSRITLEKDCEPALNRAKISLISQHSTFILKATVYEKKVRKIVNLNTDLERVEEELSCGVSGSLVFTTVVEYASPFACGKVVGSRL
ncbi:unnamed protein product [Enterobius vermicularis]|uniref:Uncharacterized protein n=1 Tax=Enterobius vermicularis TaxID=51028 RepID=A0A0N4VM76_ENTVE|nr:unnamed protein product [Enterobius vermicularis]